MQLSSVPSWFRSVARRMPAVERGGLSGLPWIAVILGLSVVINVRWIWLYRHGGIYDIDEAGYLGFALMDYQGLLRSGISGWLAAIDMPSIQAPLTMAVTSAVYVLTGPHAVAGFVVPVAAGAGCILSANALGRLVASRRAGLIAAIITASCPVIIDYSRSYQFSMLATLTTTVTLVALLRSRRFCSIVWSIAFGAGLGLMPLARTMQIAFVPGLLAAAGIFVLVERQARMQRLLMLIAACAVGTLVAATWFWSNGMRVAQYLLNFGYGAQAAEYGPHASRLGLDAWVSTAQAFAAQIYLPHFLLICLSSVATAALLCRSLAERGRRETIARWSQSAVLPVWIFLVFAILALTSSGNKGTGFFAPLIPEFAVLVGWSIERCCRSHASMAAASVVVSAVALLALAPKLDLYTPLSKEWSTTFPILGSVPITNGRGTIQIYESVAGYGARGASEPLDEKESRAWTDSSITTAMTLARSAGEAGGVAFGFRNALYNINTVNLQQLLHHRATFSGRMIEPTLTGRSVAGYLGWMRRETTDACVLLTSDRAHGDFAPAIDRAMMDAAAAMAGFVRIRRWLLPDGQTVVLWTHLVAPVNCPR